MDQCSDYDGGVLTYIPDYEIKIGKPDKHSFVEKQDGECTYFSEKIAVSTEALVGVHYFKSKKVFIDAYENMIECNERAPNGEFYMSLMYNSVLRNGGKVAAIPLQKNEKFFPVGDPENYFKYTNTHCFGPELLPKSNTICDLPSLKVQLLNGETATCEFPASVVILSGENFGDIYDINKEDSKFELLRSILV